MKLIRNILCILVLFTASCRETTQAFSFPLQVQEIETAGDENTLKVLSWNIYMLPNIVPLKGKLDRAQTIVDSLQKTDFDIIVFQEAFLKSARTLISNGLRSLYPYQYGPANDKGSPFKISSGVWVISKIPLKILNTTQFKDCAVSDCFARKGAMLLEGLWNNKPFQILGTHLQAENFPKVREKQMDQIYLELLSEYRRDGVPQIICGDMNTERDIEQHYGEMLDCFNAEDGEISSIETCSYDGVENELAQSFGAQKKMNYDYILLRANGSKARAVKRLVSVFKKGKKHLSDHYGVACELKF